MTDQSIVRDRLRTRQTVVHTYQPSLKHCASRYVGLVKTLKAGSVEDSSKALEAALQELERYEFEVSRCRVIGRSCDSEIKEYSKLYAEIEQKIEEKAAHIRANLEEVRADMHKKHGEAQSAAHGIS